jgi:hypothetical protein
MKGSLDARIVKVTAYAEAMADLYFSAHQKLAILDGLVEPEVVAIFGRSFGAHAYQALARTLLLDVIRDAWAIALDGAERAPSLRNVWRMLNTQDLLHELRARFTTPMKAKWLSTSLSVEVRAAFDQQFEVEERIERQRVWNKIHAQLSDKVPQLLQSDIAMKLQGARHKAIAHYDMVHREDQRPELFDLGKLGLKWGDPTTYLAQVEHALFDLGFLITRASYDRDGFKEANFLYAKDFWSRLQGKGEYKKGDK